MSPRLFVSCAEPSGDRLAADVLRLVLEHDPDLEIHGCCGPHLRALGAQSLVDMESVAVMGVAEVFRHLGTILTARSRLRAGLRDNPSLALFVDGPSLHLPLAVEARARGVTTVGLVCPQIWAWKPERTAHIARAYDHIWCLFDFEPPLLQAACTVHNSTVHHMGHPVLDRLPPASERRPASAPLFGLAPGSRVQELDRHSRAFLETARRVRASVPQARFLWAGQAPRSMPAWVQATPDIGELQACHAVLSKSGTVTLELAWMGVPQVVAHDVSPLTLAVGRALIRHVDHIALPNVLNRRLVVPEFLGTPQPSRLAQALLAQVDRPPVPLPHVGPPGGTARMAQALGDLLPPTGPSRHGRLPGAP